MLKKDQDKKALKGLHYKDLSKRHSEQIQLSKQQQRDMEQFKKRFSLAPKDDEKEYSNKKLVYRKNAPK